MKISRTSIVIIMHFKFAFRLHLKKLIDFNLSTLIIDNRSVTSPGEAAPLALAKIRSDGDHLGYSERRGLLENILSIPIPQDLHPLLQQSEVISSFSKLLIFRILMLSFKIQHLHPNSLIFPLLSVQYSML